MTAVIETRRLSKQFPNGRGVHDVTLRVEPGAVYGFLGPNGAGKSTFVKMLAGLIRPTSGEAQILGFPLGHLEARRRLGYLPELFRYQDWLTAEEVLRFHAKLCRLPAPVAERRITRVLADVGLSQAAHARVRTFSKGMQQRLGLACALVAEPQLLLLDEPASALDPGGRRQIRELLAELAAAGTTVFLNTHQLEDVESVCTDVALLIDGRVRAQGRVDEILHPEPVWEFDVGGWSDDDEASVRAALEALPGEAGGGRIERIERVERLPGDAVHRLQVRLEDAEQAAWFNALLMAGGLSVYRVQSKQRRLESWFLDWTAEKGGSTP
ncbi:MAG: ABC transporter ATP-binding protein [Alicyclobacillaceae bacterium]|nr:ABC transporter ATP-binding protein [Alicyclobacillaceae bacterium]